MKVVDNGTNRKDQKKKSDNKHYLRPKLNVYNEKKKVTKSDSHQIKPKQNNVTYISLETIWELSSMRLNNRSEKEEKRGAKFKTTFLFLKTINFSVINVIRY